MAILPWVPVIGWFVLPFLNFSVTKLLSYLDFHLSRKLDELKFNIIPSLKQILGDLTEQRMLRGAKDEGKGSESDLETLAELEKKLKFALYDADDVLDLVEYRKIENQVICGDGKSQGTSISSRVLQAISNWIACCKRSSFGQKLWQCAQNLNQKLRYLGEKLQQFGEALDLKFWEFVAKIQNLKQMFRDLPLRATLVQCAQSLHQYIHQGAAGQTSTSDAPGARSAAEDDIEQATMPSPTPDDAPSNPPSPNAVLNSAGSAAEFSGDNQHGSAQEARTLDHAPTNALVQISWDCFGSMFALLCSFYLAMLHLRDWSWEAVGIKNDDDTATEWVLSINEIINLRKRIKNIEYAISDSNESPLLNQNSSSSTSKDANKERSSSCTVKNSADESTSTQKEIDDVYRSIKKQVFGRDKDREHISTMLCEGSGTNAASSSTSKPYSVIGIYGITGSGKSTLAQYVCDDEKVAKHFNLIMFILVGKAFSVRDIFREVLDQIKQQQASNAEDPKILKTELKDLKSLKAEFEKELKGKCFLLVLDDLWVNADNMKEREEREILLHALCVGQSGCRILVTAQKTDAAAALGAPEQMQIPIPDLEEEQYLSMFMHYALELSKSNDIVYESHKAIGRKITEKLHRSPIAARTMAAGLQSNNSIDFWETTASLDVLNETMGALWWSYQQLGDDISQCFTYCRIFPNGYEINRDELVRLWIAQGFVKTRNNATEELEDIGQSYFDKLLTFSFLQVTYIGKETEAFTIHDLLHELVERVSRGDFFRIGSNDPPKIIPRGVHHLSIETNNAVEIAKNILDLGNLRTLIIKEPYAWSMKTVERNHDLEKLLERLFMRSTKLRALIITLNNGPTELSVPASIDQMKHLRYLGIHGLFNLILPRTFSKLYHIQTIDISGFKASCPEDMANLIYLRHISAPLSFSNIGRLTALQTLKEFKVKEEPGHELKQLMHLNSLRGSLIIGRLLTVRSKDQAIEAHLIHKKRLRRLKLDFGWDKRDPDVEAQVLKGLCPPKDIQELQIWYYGGSRYPSWMLSRHRPDAPKQLHKLELRYCSQLASIPEGSELFIVLRELCIHSCDWDSLPENMEHLVSLQTLEIWSCEKMKHLPTLPQALKKIVISGCHMLRSFDIMDCPRLEFVMVKEKCLEASTSLEYCQDTALTGTPEQSPYPIIPCPCLVTLEIRYCANLVTLPNLPPSLKTLLIHECRELCSMSGQLHQLKELDIYKCNKLQSADSLGNASSLETLSLWSCQCLASLGSDGGPGSYLALRRLWIDDCPAMDMKQFNKNVLIH